MTSSRVHLPGVGQSLAENFSLSCLQFLSLWESLWTFVSHKECFRIFQNLLRNLPEFLCKRDYVFGSKEGDSTKSIISLVTPRSRYQCWRPGGVRRCERAEVWSTPTEWSLTANATTLSYTLSMLTKIVRWEAAVWFWYWCWCYIVLILTLILKWGIVRTTKT